MDSLESYKHSLETLDILNNYQDFMSNIKSVTDMGSNPGLDAAWWARLKRTENNSPRNIKVSAVDINLPDTGLPKDSNITYIKRDFSDTGLAPNSQNLIWAHNSFQYSISPMHTLMHWHDILTPDGMLLIAVPYNFSTSNNKDIINAEILHQNAAYFNFSLGSLIMMLIACGFDCKEAHFKIDKEQGWIHAAVYKSKRKPKPNMNWYEMFDLKLLPLCLEESIYGTGNFNETQIVVEWLDRSQYIVAL